MSKKEKANMPAAGRGKPKLSMSSIKRTIGFLFKAYPAAICIIGICIVTTSVIGILPSVYIKTITGYIQEGLVSGWGSVYGKIMHTLLIMLALYCVALISSTLQSQIMARVTQGFLHKMRTRMFSGMQKLPIRYFDSNSDGDIMSHYTNDIDTLRQLISQSLPNLISAGLVIVGVLVVMLYYSIPLMFIVFVGIFFMALATKKVGGTSAKYFIRQQQSLGAVEGYIEEMMHGQKVVKVFCHEEKAQEDFDKLNEALCSDMTTANKYGNIFMPIIGNIGNMLYVLIAFAGGLMVTSGGFVPNISFENLFSTGNMVGALSIPVIASFLGMVKQFTGNVGQVSQQINSVAMALAGAERIFSLIDEAPEADNGDVTLVNCREENGVLTECEEHTGIWAWKYPATAEYEEEKLVRVCGDVSFADVDFEYEEGKPVLHDVSLFAEPGQKIAFVGATGAGKTTITNLINRFYDIADGKIRYDGININRIKKSDLRRSLGIVLQDVNLFTGTVMENIRYGKLDATDEECIEAAKLANAHNFIMRLPDGYNTMLDGGGANLSQGQRQLLSIARAAVADPPVMILDEATSSIDTRTELLVQRGMDALMKDRTVFVIAHRLSTVQNSDAIMVLDHGRIIERGNHDSLIAEKGTYYQLYTGAFELE